MDLRYTVPVLGVCLLAGIVPGCICHWTPPDTRFEPADTTGLGLDVIYPVTTMWPGEMRRFALPSIDRVTVPVQFIVRGSHSVMLTKTSSSAYLAALTGSVSPSRPQSPSLNAALMMASLGGASFVQPLVMTTAPRECWVHVDSLAAPGDSIALRFTVTSATTPPRRSRWIWPIRVTAPRTTPAGSANLSTLRAARIIKHPPKEESISAYPNPFNPRTTVKFALTSPGKVTVNIHAATGTVVRSLVGGEQRDVGVYAIEWDGRAANGAPVGSGIYFVRMATGRKSVTCKLVLLK